MAVDLSGYNDVPARIAEFREKHPGGSLQPANRDKPYWVEVIGDRCFIVYVAAAYRSPDDTTPGIGMAWEPFPGRTTYTKDSELQNAETSAWGRAIVAALAADTKKGIASQEDVRNRREDQQVSSPPPGDGKAQGGRASRPRSAPPAAAETPSEHFARLASRAGSLVHQTLGKDTIDNSDEANKVADALSRANKASA